MTVQFTSGAGPDDQLIVTGMSPDDGGQIFDGSSNLVATVTGGMAGDPLVITFTSFATPSEVQSILERIAFADYSNTMPGGDRTVTFTLTDGDGGTSNVATATIHTTVVDTPPTLNALD